MNFCTNFSLEKQRNHSNPNIFFSIFNYKIMTEKFSPPVFSLQVILQEVKPILNFAQDWNQNESLKIGINYFENETFIAYQSIFFKL